MNINMKQITLFMVSLGLCACNFPAQTAQTTQGTQTSHQADTDKQAQAHLLRQGIEAYEQQNYNEAMMVFTQLSATGHMKAPRYIGLMYLNGYGVEKNAQRAVAEFNKAAVLGDITSQFWLGYCYEQGIGVAQNTDEALKWYRLSAQRGDRISAPAMTALGRLSEEQNMEEAITWYRKAAQVGSSEARSALVRLGVK